jgi:hypothetical protein
MTGQNLQLRKCHSFNRPWFRRCCCPGISGLHVIGFGGAGASGQAQYSKLLPRVAVTRLQRWGVPKAVAVWMVFAFSGALGALFGIVKSRYNGVR